MLTERAEKCREDKRKININLGYFSSEKVFIEGEDMKNLKAKLLEKKEKLEIIKGEERKTKKTEQKARLKSANNFVSNEIADIEITVCCQNDTIDAVLDI